MSGSTAIHQINSYFLRKALPDDQRLVIIVLNWQLPRETLTFWEKAHLRICADGGANHLYDGLANWTGCEGKALQQHRQKHLPDIIAGDLDSIRPDVRAFYQQQGKTTIEDLSADQDSTDLQKCLQCATHHIQAHSAQFPELENVTALAVGAFGGRLDHTLGHLGELFVDQVSQPSPAQGNAKSGLELVLLGEEGSLARCIPSGTSEVRPCRDDEGPACGLLALIRPATVTFSGLRWNLENKRMEMGGLLSTCNFIDEDVIRVKTDGPLLWITQLHRP